MRRTYAYARALMARELMGYDTDALSQVLTEPTARSQELPYPSHPPPLPRPPTTHGHEKKDARIAKHTRAQLQLLLRRHKRAHAQWHAAHAVFGAPAMAGRARSAALPAARPRARSLRQHTHTLERYETKA